MSISTESYESIINLARLYQNEETPFFYDNDAHLGITCDMLILLLQKAEIKIVCTNVILDEPIVAHEDIFFICIPLLALLVNAPIKLPQNKLQFTSESFDIFQHLKFPTPGVAVPTIGDELNKIYSADSEDDYSNNLLRRSVIVDYDFSLTAKNYMPHAYIRFTQMLRITVMCVHFLQHYKRKIPYRDHSTFNTLESAKKIITTSMLQNTIDPFYNSRDNTGADYAVTAKKYKSGIDYSLLTI